MKLRAQKEERHKQDVKGQATGATIRGGLRALLVWVDAG